MADGFLGRWARRKQDAREGRPLEEPAAPAIVPQSMTEPPPVHTAAAAPVVAAPPAVQPEAPPPPPTLEDVQALTAQSDFQRFMAPDVDPVVRNAAMKKLFADPHFNVMDGLDIYIDDYNKPDPLPPSMLRQMASAKFLNLFDDEDKENPAPPAGVAVPASVAVADATPAAPAIKPDRPGLTTEDHDHTDLRLQQDHAAGPQGPGRGPQ